MIIQLENSIDNTSVQIGDQAYYVHADGLTSFSNQATGYNPQLIGAIANIGSNTITVNVDMGSNDIPNGSYIMFAKDNRANSGSLKGYYASVKMRNDSVDKAELFAVSSEVTESSK